MYAKKNCCLDCKYKIIITSNYNLEIQIQSIINYTLT
jgi:hypothetical protein